MLLRITMSSEDTRVISINSFILSASQFVEIQLLGNIHQNYCRA